MSENPSARDRQSQPGKPGEQDEISTDEQRLPPDHFGVGTETCQACGGSGKTAEGERCPACGGSGHLIKTITPPA